MIRCGASRGREVEHHPPLLLPSLPPVPTLASARMTCPRSSSPLPPPHLRVQAMRESGESLCGSVRRSSSACVTGGRVGRKERSSAACVTRGRVGRKERSSAACVARGGKGQQVQQSTARDASASQICKQNYSIALLHTLFTGGSSPDPGKDPGGSHRYSTPAHLFKGGAGSGRCESEQRSAAPRDYHAHANTPSISWLVLQLVPPTFMTDSASPPTDLERHNHVGCNDGIPAEGVRLVPLRGTGADDRKRAVRFPACMCREAINGDSRGRVCEIALASCSRAGRTKAPQCGSSGSQPNRVWEAR